METTWAAVYGGEGEEQEVRATFGLAFLADVRQRTSKQRRVAVREIVTFEVGGGDW